MTRFLLLIPLALLILLSVTPIQLATADLGRHIVTGKLLVQEGLSSSVLTTNRYSFTHPAYATQNHHWLFGVLVYGLVSLGGFSAVSLIVPFSILGAVGVLIFVIRKISTVPSISISLFLLIPLLTFRTEVRPELLSMFLFASTLGLLILHRQNIVGWKTLFGLLTLIQFFWIQLHIFFVLGFLAVFVFGISDSRKHWKHWLALLSLSIGVSLLNPQSYKALIFPLSIFSTYEYEIIENQSIWFLLSRFGLLIYAYGLLSLALTLVGSLVWAGFRFFKKTKNSHVLATPLVIIACILTLVNFQVIRLLPFTAIALFPLLTLTLNSVAWKKIISRISTKEEAVALTAPLAITCVVALLSTGLFLPRWSSFGIGLQPENQPAIEFMQERIQGPIFNNYDVGGMLIYALYPRLSVYTDNRPEAYPPGFFPNDYIAPQEDATKWHALLQQHDFQTIIFYRHDATPWGQPFLIERIAEDEWQPVYVDQSILILARDSAVNADLIKSFGLPKTIFTSLPQ